MHAEFGNGMGVYPRIPHVILMEAPVTHEELAVLREFQLGNVVIYMRGGVPSPLCIPQFWNSSIANRQRYIPPPPPPQLQPPQPQPPTVPVNENINDDVIVISDNDDDNDVNDVEPDDDDNEVQDVVIIISDEDD